MAKILLEVRDNVLIASTEGVITSDTISVPCSISFSDEWAQYGKTIFFYQNPRKMHRVVVAGQSADFEVPPQAIITGGELHIGVFGNYTDSEGNPQRKVAVATSVPAAKGSYNGTDLPKPSVSEYEQIISIMMAYMDAREVAEIAKEAAEQIATDASAVKGYVDEASAHAAAAQTAAAASASARDESLAAINEALSARDEVVEVAEEALNEMGGYNAKVQKNSKRATNAEDASTVKTPDSSVAYTKTVPQNALPYAEITEIGGMTYKDGDTLRSAPVSAVESAGANLLPYPYDDTTKTANGITFTDNGDGSITVNGTATADAVFNLSRVWIKATQKYFASGCPLGGSQTTYYLLPRGFGKDTGNGILINGTSSDFSSLSQIVITSGTTVNNLVFKPMLNAGTTAKPYAPYLKRTFEIPEAARAKNGINENVYDYIDLTEAKKCVRVGMKDAGTLKWTVWDSDGDGVANRAYSDRFAKPNGSVIASALPVGSRDVYIDAYGAVCAHITDGGYTSETFKAAMSGVMLYYELAEPIITDISDILPADNFIQVEEGGTVTMVNEREYDVPSTVVYRVPKVGDDYVMISSPNGTVYKLTVSDSGSISAVKT